MPYRHIALPRSSVCLPVWWHVIENTSFVFSSPSWAKGRSEFQSMQTLTFPLLKGCDFPLFLLFYKSFRIFRKLFKCSWVIWVIKPLFFLNQSFTILYVYLAKTSFNLICVCIPDGLSTSKWRLNWNYKCIIIHLIHLPQLHLDKSPYFMFRFSFNNLNLFRVKSFLNQFLIIFSLLMIVTSINGSLLLKAMCYL